MKTQPIFLVLALILGISIGWLVKPGPGPSTDAAGAEDKIPSRSTDEPRTTANTGAGEENDPPRRKTEARAIVIGDGEEPTPEEQAMQDKISKAMAERQSKSDERKIKALIGKLGLDATQEAALREYFSERRDELAKLFSGDSGAAPDMSNFSESKLDDLMAGVLTDEQKEEYEEVKTAEREKKVESRALKDLAKLNSVIDLRPEQKDAVYEVLYDDAGSKVDKAAESGVSVFSTMFGSGMGIEMDLDSSAMHDSIYLEGGDNEGGDSEFSAEAFKEAQQKRVDEKVDRLSGVLDEKQLENYREHLESQGSVFESFVSPELAE